MKLLQRYSLIGILFTTLLVLTGCQEPYEFNGFVYESPQQAAEIIGTNWDGNEFRLSDQEGKVSIIFFGYTFSIEHELNHNFRT